MVWILTNGRVIDPASGRDEIADVWIDGGVVSEIGSREVPRDIPRIDCSGHIVAPGFIDLHVHLREPGREDEETIESGTRAAVRGGFTAVACMPNTDPAIDGEAEVQYVLERAKAEGLCRVLPVAAITRGREGQALCDLGGLVDAGAVAFSDDGCSLENADLMRRALEYSRMLGVPLAVHCEDARLAGGGVMNEGTVSALLGLKGCPAEAEITRVSREILLAELTRARLHIQHVSTARAMALIVEAKQRGLGVTAEVTPHHLVLTERDVGDFDTRMKVNPPLRTEMDRDTLREGLASGAIDAVATDHAPHAHEEKEVEFDEAAFGMVGLETAVGLVLTELVHPGILDLADAVHRFTLGPARAFGLELGRLEPGGPADITVVDLDRIWTVDPGDFESRSKNTPFAGRVLRGRAVGTVVNGHVAMWNGEVGRIGEEVRCLPSGNAC